MTKAEIKKIETFKTTKAAASFLNKKGIETSEGFGKSYDFYLDGKHYRIVKTSADDAVRLISYSTHSISVEQQLKALYQIPTCFGRTL